MSVPLTVSVPFESVNPAGLAVLLFVRLLIVEEPLDENVATPPALFVNGLLPASTPVPETSNVAALAVDVPA